MTTSPAPSFPRGYDLPDELRPAWTDERGVRHHDDVEVSTTLGFRPVRLDLMVPPSDGPVPVVLYIHGGAFMFGSRHENWVGGPIWRSLLDAGIAVAAVEYRLSGEAVFPACLNDLKAAVRWLRRFGAELGVRPDAIGAWGESAGGHLSAFLGLGTSDPALEGSDGVTDVPSTVQASVAWYPPTDLLSMDAQAPAHATQTHDAADSPESLLVGGAIQENPDAARFASPLFHVSPAAAPMLLLHGERDSAVPHPQSLALHAALVAAGAEAEVEIVPGAEHVFAGVDRAPLIERSTRFLAERLGSAG